MKRCLSLLLIACLIIGACAMAPARATANPVAVAFIDTAGDLHEAAIVKLAALGIVKGSATPAGVAFRPGDTITRTEFAILMLRSLGLESRAIAMTTKPSFTDVGETYRWAWGYIALAAQESIIQGSEGRFRPGDKVTHAEALTMLVRALGRENAVNQSLVWPEGHIDVAQMLGIGTAPSFRSEPATRGEVAAYLDAAFAVPRVTWGSQGDILPTGDSFLSLQGYSAAKVRIVAVSPAGVSPAWIECPDESFRPGDGDADNDRVEVAIGATLYGARDLFELMGSTADLVIDANHKLVYAAPVFTVSGIISSVKLPQITLTDGRTVTFGGEPVIRVNGVSDTESLFAHLVLCPGYAAKFTFDPKNSSRLTSIDVSCSVVGELALHEGFYTIDPAQRMRIWIGDPAGWIQPDTRVTINLRPVEQTELQNEMSNPARYALCFISFDPETGRATDFVAFTCDSQGTFAQPLVGLTPDGFTVPISGGLADSTRAYTMAPDGVIAKDGRIAGLGDLRRGDVLSFRTNSAGQVSFLLAAADITSPVIVRHLTPKNTLDRDWIAFDEAIDPATVRVTVDGVPFSLAPDNDFNVVGNYVRLLYERSKPLTVGRATLMIWPEKNFSEGQHTIQVTVSDFGGHQTQQTLTIEYDITPAKAQSIAFGVSDKRVIEITFDDEMASSVSDLSAWYSANRADFGLLGAGYNALTRTLTLTMKEAYRGVTVTSRNLIDAAGNPVEITFTTPE